MSLLPAFETAVPSDFSGQAIDAAGDPHLAPGIHLRLGASPDLGLPVRPFELVRLSLGQGRTWPGVRRDMLWVDQRGERLLPPFDVEIGNRVRGFLPHAGRANCCWVRVEVSGGGPVRPFPFPPAPPMGPISPLLHGGSGAILRPTGEISAARAGGLVARAISMTESGPAVVAERNAGPVELAATPIDWIELEGRGRVEGARWLNVHDILADILRRIRLPEQDPDRLERWRLMSLPVTNSVRYAEAPPTAVADADQRVKEAAPRRFGLDDEPGLTGPAASPPATPGDEVLRMEDITPELGRHLQALVDTDTPGTLTEAVGGLTPGGGTLSLPVLLSVLQALGDPSVARWAGYSIADTKPPTARLGDLVVYGVVGAWEVPEPIDGGTRIARLGTVLAAVVGHPGVRPAPPGIDPPVSGAFLPLPPPQARRAVTLGFTGLVPAAGLAVARRLGGVVTGLNRRAPSGRAIAHLAGEADAAAAYGVAKFVDRSAPADAFTYRGAQRDWFGRWSEWAERDTPAAPRPLPPRPVLQVTYAAPSVTGPPQTGAIRGTVTVSVPIPPVKGLAPGSRLLSHLELALDGAVRIVPLPDPVEPNVPLVTDIDGAPIERGGTRDVTVTARWVDTAGARSAEARQGLAIADPRPAPDVSLPPGLRYTSRPDASGRARFRLDWLPGPGQAAFRVYYGDEPRLIDGLGVLAGEGGAQGAQAQAALDALDGADDPAERAEIIAEVADLLPRDLFEQITPAPLAAAAPGTTVGIDHSVDAALQVLSFYRVTSVTRANVESRLADAPLVAVRVPNTLRPARPALSLAPRIEPDGSFVAELTVEVALGNVPASEVRVRRAVEGPVDPAGMPVAVSGTPQTTLEGRQRAVLEDRGAAPFGGTLRPWLRYVWRAEARGPAEPGGGPGAEWSEASVPVSHLFVPPVPVAPLVTALDPIAGGAELRFTHPDPLRGALGRGYVLEVHRQVPGERVTLFRSVSAGAPPEKGGRDPSGEFKATDTEDPPVGTSYTVLVRDPLGRASAASPPAILAEA